MSELGDKLRDARLEKGYTIDDLQKITKIQKRYLTAIEEGRLDQLPGDFYVRAFVKQYADSVGLDSQALIEDYQSEIPKVQPEETPVQSPTVKKEALAPNLKRHWPQIVILAVVLIIVILICLVAAKVHKQNANPIPTSHQKVEQTTTKKPKRHAKKTVAKQSTKQTTANKNLVLKADANVADHFTIQNWSQQSQHEVKLQATSAQAWVAVRANGQTVWQGALQPNSEQTVQLGSDLKQFQVQTGNAAVTKVLINDQNLPVPDNQTGTVHTYTMQIKE